MTPYKSARRMYKLPCFFQKMWRFIFRHRSFQPAVQIELEYVTNFSSQPVGKPSLCGQSSHLLGASWIFVPVAGLWAVQIPMQMDYHKHESC
jgi:hypothetical protein